MHHQFFKKITTSVVFFTLFLVSFTSKAQVQTARQISMSANSKGYLEYLPQGYGSSNETYPLIIFIHGTGEKGTDLNNLAGTGLPRLIRDGRFPTSFTVNGQTSKFIVISPQFTVWPKAPEIETIYQYIISHYRVNINKVYVTGLSMGGGVTWEYVGNSSGYNKHIAAIVPIAGASYAAYTRANNIADSKLPVWATHNNGDPTVTVDYTINYVNLIKQRDPNAIAKYTIFTSNSHDAWTKTYDPNFREAGLNIYEWMLQFSRNLTTTTPPANQSPVAKAGSDVTITLPVNSVQLAGSGTDADGSIASYTWTQQAGPTTATLSSTTQASTTVSNLSAGTYTFRLTVKDNSGATSSDDINIVVNAAPVTPPSTSGKSIRVNIFGGTNPYNNTQWNNWSMGKGSAIVSSLFKYDDGTASTVKATLSQSTGIGDNSTSLTGGIAPAEVLRYTSYSTVGRTLTISGLSSSKTYSLELYASRTSNSGNNTVFSVGSSRDTVNCYNNKTDKALFTSIVPNAQGEIVVNISRLVTYNYLNGFVLSEGTIASATSTVLQSNTQASETLNSSSSISVYPNPVQDQVVVQVTNDKTGAMKIQVTDLSGVLKKSILTSKGTSGTIQTYLSLSDLKPGEYFISVSIDNWVETKKITKL